MFSYKGIDNEYKYKRGTVEANSEIEAINLIKSDENILIIVGLKKISNIKFINNIRKGFTTQVVTVENRINNYTRKISERKEKNKIKTKQKEDSAEGKTELSRKSPILRGIGKLAASIPSRQNKIVIDEDMYDNLQFMFKEQSQRDKEEKQNNYSMSITRSDFSDNKISDVKENKKKDNTNEKEINWSLLDVDEENPEIKYNRKIKVKEKEIIMFTRRLHIMLSSGVTLLSSLSLLEKTSSKNMSKVLAGVLSEIQQGMGFSEAIAKYPRQFNYAYVSLVAIGETSGSLDRSLSDIIKMKEQEQKVKRKIRTASIYPMIVGFVLVVMMIAASVFFLPKFEEMFVEQELATPRFTQIVFGIAGKFPMIISIIAVFVIILTFARKKVPEINYMYRRYIDKSMLKLPVMRAIMNSMYMHSFSSTISLMLNNGIRLSDTLSLTGKTINNIYIKNEIEDIGQLMTHGLTFSEAMAEQPHFDDILVNIALTGEESGQMIFSLQQVADYFEIELNKQVDAMMEVVPPLSIALIALLAAPVIIAAYLPILEISTGAGLGL